ncbi:MULTISPECIES: Asp-tRNA(Asn)/Glu-tRNA(Gln) amidotransferase subunit GatC [Acidithrix]|uniref:Aspartyl/glutamyl-tRNA(Asn/Gln) amidotransferase subunit C n=1 Tax=Acidithrix ferrooxidans TaxID=1280514 RepID=A0A0D8HEW5_9ACTN|nr:MULTISPECIES: Asp-tRNA(Asn)/Glu-tRNA(Gln) amidotransferase subunit GatC [Acidithrix]KJF16463.1 aspartyl/glutamyl-tRNA(Asn/Gln) amidotransferase subunit C [Acidithrix ferrooxidans]
MSADKISSNETRHIAHLARLALSEAEIEDFTGQLAAILEHAKDIESLNLDDVAPTRHALPIKNVMRSDEVRKSVNREEVLRMAPETQANMFLVPKIIGED